MKITAKLTTKEGRVISEAAPFEKDTAGEVPTVIHVPIITGLFRRRHLVIVVRIEP